MPKKQSITLEEFLNKLENYSNQLKEIIDLEDQLNQERFLVCGELQKVLCDIDSKITKLKDGR